MWRLGLAVLCVAIVVVIFAAQSSTAAPSTPTPTTTTPTAPTTSTPTAPPDYTGVVTQTMCLGNDAHAYTKESDSCTAGMRQVPLAAGSVLVHGNDLYLACDKLYSSKGMMERDCAPSSYSQYRYR